ncbi:MAG: DUF6799 domain-containing protein [Prosthecobacter sp.]
MKTLIQSLACACLSLGLATTSFSADKPNNESKMSKEAKPAADANHIAIKDGKAWVMKDGTKVELTGPVALLDGTQVMPDGSYTLPNSTEKHMLKDGEAITWAGKVVDHDKLMKDLQTQKLRDDAARKATRD